MKRSQYSLIFAAFFVWGCSPAENQDNITDAHSITAVVNTSENTDASGVGVNGETDPDEAVARAAREADAAGKAAEAAGKAAEEAAARERKMDKPEAALSNAPEYDVISYCAKVADSIGGSFVIEKSCREQEYSARSDFEDMQISDRIFNYCDRVASSIGGSYAILKSCAEQEIEAAQSL